MITHNRIQLNIREKSIDLTHIEEKFNITFPPIYKFFIQNFEETLNIPRYGKKDRNGKMGVFNIAYPNSETDDSDILAFEQFLSPEEIFKYEDVYMEWKNEFGLIPISRHALNASLWLGIREENEDEIYFALMGGEKRYLDRNIFDFLRSCNIQINHLIQGKLHTLEKKYTDQFWNEQE